MKPEEKEEEKDEAAEKKEEQEGEAAKGSLKRSAEDSEDATSGKKKVKGEASETPAAERPRHGDPSAEQGGNEVVQITREVQAFVEAEGKAKMPVNDVSQLRCKLEWRSEVEKILDCDDVEQLQQIQLWLTKSKASFKQLLGGSKKAAQKVRAHINNKLRGQVRELTKKKKDEEKKVLAETKRAAKEASAKLENPELPAFFKSWDAISKLPSVCQMAIPSGDRSENFAVDSPWVLADFPETDTWKKCGKVQLVLSHFASGYKKDDNTKNSGKGQNQWSRERESRRPTCSSRPSAPRWLSRRRRRRLFRAAHRCCRTHGFSDTCHNIQRWALHHMASAC